MNYILNIHSDKNNTIITDEDGFSAYLNDCMKTYRDYSIFALPLMQLRSLLKDIVEFNLENDSIKEL